MKTFRGNSNGRDWSKDGVERKVSFIFGRISKDKMKLSRKSTLLLSGLFDSFSPKAKEIFWTSSSDIL